MRCDTTTVANDVPEGVNLLVVLTDVRCSGDEGSGCYRSNQTKKFQVR